MAQYHIGKLNIPVWLRNRLISAGLEPVQHRIRDNLGIKVVCIVVLLLSHFLHPYNGYRLRGYIDIG